MNEIEKVKSNPKLTDDERRKALKQILDKETELLQTIDRLKIIANKVNQFIYTICSFSSIARKIKKIKSTNF